MVLYSASDKEIFCPLYDKKQSLVLLITLYILVIELLRANNVYLSTPYQLSEIFAISETREISSSYC